MIKTKTVKLISNSDWDNLVQSTYNRPYCFQQQEDCRDRGSYELTVPNYDFEDSGHDSIPEEVNGSVMCVKFNVWLSRDPNQFLNSSREDYGDESENLKMKKFHLELFWERNFYPELEMVANDLYEKGLLEAGEYLIDVDW